MLIGRELIEVFLQTPVSSNAREILHAHTDRITYVDVDDPRVTTNVNTQEDYSSLE
jgi:CTP:molybdopterin cytidylyltransferase MocA